MVTGRGIGHSDVSQRVHGVGGGDRGGGHGGWGDGGRGAIPRQVSLTDCPPITSYHSWIDDDKSQGVAMDDNII